MEPRNWRYINPIIGWAWVKELRRKVEELTVEIKKTGMDDPRRLIHSLKVGLALTLVSLFYYFEPLYTSFGVSAMWAVMTVVVVFEFSVGATLGKGLNRGLATLLAGGMGLGAHHLASITGKTCEPILIGLFVFLQAVASTFVRFFPAVKARYDYGMLIFILTFCLVSISGLRTDEILGLAQKRLSTIVIGASTCLVVSIFVYPVWAGQDLHILVANNIHKIGCFLEGYGGECLRACEESENGRSIIISSLGSLNSVVDSKSTVETLANFARWEPGHGQFMYRHPWKQYLKIAGLTRQCACRVEALKGYLNSKTQAPLEIQSMIASMSSECGKALKELARSVETMTKPNPRPANLKIASKNLSTMLRSEFWEEGMNLLQVMPVAAVASLLNDIAASVESIADAIDELSALASFKFQDSISGPVDLEDDMIINEKNNNTNNNNISLVSVVIDGAGKSSIQILTV